MAIILQAVKDLSLHSGPCGGANGNEVWKSDGDDPVFLFSKTTKEQKYLVLLLSSHGAPIDPKFYPKRGRRYHEEDAIVPPENTDFVFVIESPANTKPRPLRFDPCSFMTLFSLCHQQIGDPASMEAAVSAALLRTPKAHVEFISWTEGSPVKRWLRSRLARFSKPTVQSHAAKLYLHAEKELMHIRVQESASIWLSVVVPTYNTPIRYLQDILLSFRRQDISGTELIFSDDGSTEEKTTAWLEQLSFQDLPDVRIVRGPINRGISAATNAGLSEARGRWIALLDHDDVIAPAAFKNIYKTIIENREIKFIYTDTLVVREDLKALKYILKPAYDPVMLTGMNYINHFSIFRKDCIARTGWLRSDLDGSQDYDFLLRYLSTVNDEEILHLPYPAYWWRRHKKSFSRQNMETATRNARRAIVAHFSKLHQNVTVTDADTAMFHKVTFSMPRAPAKVSIVIPNRNSYGLIRSLLRDLYEGTDYPNFEVIVIDNGTTDERVLELYSSYKQKYANFSSEVTEEAFNFSKSINRGCAVATGDMFLLLNNDVEVIDKNWLNEMVTCFQFKNVGIVGAKLLYPNDKLQHAGVIVGFGGLAGHWYHGKPKDFGGHTNRLHVRASMACVTAAVMLISRECADAVGLWDEENFKVAYNDVDYCMRAFKLGYRIVWTPFACLYHHESVSRGSDRSPENRARFEREKANLKRIHGTGSFSDPASNPFFTINSSEPQLRQCNSLPKARTWFGERTKDL